MNDVIVLLQYSVLCFMLTKAPTPVQSTVCRSINAAFSLPNDAGTFFLSGRRFVEYSFQYKTEKRSGLISHLGITQSRIQAAFTGTNDDVIILQECFYHRYDASQGIPLQLIETRNMSDMGLPCDVKAALRWADQTVVFKGCDLWMLNSDVNLFEPNGQVTSRQLPCNLDAALEWDDGAGLFIKGHQYWKFVWQATGPYHIDDLHICSWYICGEADWMLEYPSRDEVLNCNGDQRLCPLRLNQVTLAGLHNAGAGFQGGFGFLDCWMLNHGLNITRQLEIGIRHLDIDPCFETCGLLGTCHSFACGGSICVMIKQIRRFLKSHRHDVITLNFNHQIVDARKVFRGLTKQLKTQLKPMLSTYFRQTGYQRWPTLRHSIMTNRRVFVFYAPIIVKPEYARRYRRNLWIHNENLIGSTWTPFNVYSSCQEVVNLTAARCDVRQYRNLVEVSIIPEFGGCVSTMAGICREHLHNSLRACQPYLFQHGRSPNIILVDFPEVDRQEVTSVFHAVYHQNVRNVAQHRLGTCRVSIDAAVTLSGQSLSLFFVGSRIIEFHHRLGAQTNRSEAPGYLQDIDAAYESTRPGYFHVIKDCQDTEVHAATFLAVTSFNRSDTSCTSTIQAAVKFQDIIYTFQGCQIHRSDSSTTVSTASWGIPCHIDAAMLSTDGGQIYIFKGNNLWKYSGQGVASYEGPALNWNIDVVECST